MADRIIRGMAGNGQIRFFGVDCLETVQEAQRIHHLSITTSVLMGRLLAAGLMMGLDQKSERELLTLKINGKEAVKTVLVTSDNQGNVKGYIDNPQVELPLRENGGIDVSGALGDGTLTVIKDVGAKRPYMGTIKLQNGEIGTDLSYYFSQSEQIPTAIGLGVLIEPEGRIRQAGGFMVQLLPEAEVSVIDMLEANFNNLPNLSDLLDMGYTIEKIIENMILKGLEPEIKSSQAAQYHCDCSREKFEMGIRLLDKEELEESISKSEDIVIQCHFCNKEYRYDKEVIEGIVSSER